MTLDNNSRLLTLMKRQYEQQRETYRQLQGSLYPAIAYVDLQKLKERYIAAGGQEADLPHVPHPTMLAQLLATNDKELVEASPVDIVWGIGLAEDDPRALDKTQWRGQNLLGKALMSARDMLRRRDDFAKWYHQEVGISLDDAKRREVYDLDLIESAWLAGYKFAQEQA